MSEQNNLHYYVSTTLAKTGVHCTGDDIDFVRRIGKYRQGHIRPVLVRFNRESKRNFFPCAVSTNNRVCTSVEQAYQLRKAKFHNDHRRAKKITKTRNPYEAHRLGNKVPSSAEWTAIEEHEMYDLLMAKFTQNEYLRQYLIDTGDKHLHEATVDSKWATGADLSSKNTANGTWSGKDVLGTILENVRNAIANGNKSMMPTPPEIEHDQVDEIDLRPMPTDVEDSGLSNGNTSTADRPPPHAAQTLEQLEAKQALALLLLDPVHSQTIPNLLFLETKLNRAHGAEALVT